MYLNQSPGRSQKYKYKAYSPGGGDSGETVKAKGREGSVFKISPLRWTAVDGISQDKRSRLFFFSFFFPFLNPHGGRV